MLSGEEHVLFQPLPAANSMTDLQHLCVSSGSQPLWVDTQASCSLPCPSDLDGVSGRCTQVMQILVYFESPRDLTKFLKYFLPKVLFLYKNTFLFLVWQVDFILQLLSLYYYCFFLNILFS